MDHQVVSLRRLQGWMHIASSCQLKYRFGCQFVGFSKDILLEITPPSEGLKFFIDEHVPSKRITHFAGFHKYIKMSLMESGRYCFFSHPWLFYHRIVWIWWGNWSVNVICISTFNSCRLFSLLRSAPAKHRRTMKVSVSVLSMNMASLSFQKLSWRLRI